MSKNTATEVERNRYSLVGPEATAERLIEETLGLLGDHRRLHAAGEAARALAGRDAASEIAELILTRIG